MLIKIYSHVFNNSINGSDKGYPAVRSHTREYLHFNEWMIAKAVVNRGRNVICCIRDITTCTKTIFLWTRYLFAPSIRNDVTSTWNSTRCGMNVDTVSLHGWHFKKWILEQHDKPKIKKITVISCFFFCEFRHICGKNMKEFMEPPQNFKVQFYCPPWGFIFEENRRFCFDSNPLWFWLQNMKLCSVKHCKCQQKSECKLLFCCLHW